ncbi:MAG TPA: heavy metal-binding domain-containing protein [Pirellulales bacterium]|nr:heavy metal-binding domain-containing protein [Pirellulales bacterium]
MAIMSGLSGNEIYCLHLKGLKPGELVIGNSVYSTGLLGALGAGFRSMVGGEVTQVTQAIHEGREQSYERMMTEARERGGVGVTGVTSDLKPFRGNIEFLSVASSIHGEKPAPEHISFSTSGDGQQLYCQLDAGYTPLKFVFGNVAYSIGIGGSLLGSLKSLGRGEIKEYSDVFNHTRHLALQRIVDQAKAVSANAVIGIETRVLPFQGVHEMMMMGTASHNEQLPAAHDGQPVSSDLTCEEMWNLTSLGYYPLKLLLGTAVYSLGILGGLKAAFKSFSRGEIHDLTSLIYDAREHAIGLISDEAKAIGADDVVGIKTHIHEFNGLIEFMAIGTAIKRGTNLSTQTPQLPPQAIIKDKDTWINEDSTLFGRGKADKSSSAGDGGSS